MASARTSANSSASLEPGLATPLAEKLADPPAGAKLGRPMDLTQTAALQDPSLQEPSLGPRALELLDCCLTLLPGAPTTVQVNRAADFDSTLLEFAEQPFVISELGRQKLV